MSKPEKKKSIPAASLKILAGRAPTFPLTVIIKPVGGDEFTVTFTALAQRKSEWACARDAYLGGLKQDAEAKAEDAQAEEFSFAKTIGQGMDGAAELILKCASGWSLEDEFNAANLVALEDLCGGALSNLLSAYDAAIFAGRLGN